MTLVQRVEAVAAVLRESLPADMAEERARNIVQALVDENEFHPTIREIRREEAVRHALVFWHFAPDGWLPLLEIQAQVLKALEAT